MNSSQWQRIQEIFHRVSDEPADRRQQLLNDLCEGDAGLMAQVQSMLEVSDTTANLPYIEPRTVPAVDEFGPYRLLRPLGEGGMGVVYLAQRDDIGSTVAIKLLKNASLSPSLRQRFTDEQRTLARLQHPLIAQIHDADSLSDGTPWFAMEYVEGKPITEYCRDKSCSIEECLRLFRLVCEAVQFAHSHAIIHRDLKPGNILVKSDGAVKLLDFGIAKQIEDPRQPVDQTATALRPMTLAYAAPEQIRGEPVGTWSDVFSLGVNLYELLTGRLPFDLSGCSRAEAERLIVDEEPKPPSAVASRQPSSRNIPWGDLDVLCLTALQKDPRRRYQSAEALLRDVDHYLNSQPLEARPDTLGYRLGKFVRRHRRPLAAAMATLLLIVALTTFFIAGIARARNAAIAEATRTQRIEQFMLNLFDGGDKDNGPSEDLRVVSLLDRGVQSTPTLNEEPAVKAELNQTLGNIYQRLGKYDQADKLLRASLDQREAIQGPDGPDVADNLIALGLLRMEQSRDDEAERFVRQGLAMDQRHLAPDDPAIARALSALGRVLADRDDDNGAIKVLEQAVRIQSARPASFDLSESTRDLGIAHYHLGQFAVATSLYQRSLELDRQLYGLIHPRVADDWISLGQVENDVRNFPQAERDYRHALEIDKSWYGAQHPATAHAETAVAQALTYQNRLDEAAPLLQDALAIQERVFGPMHTEVAQVLNTLGMLEIKRGHFDDATRDLTRMEDIDRSIYGDGDIKVAIAILNLGAISFARKEYPRAEHDFRDALSRLTEKLPPGHSYIAAAECKLGQVLVAEHKYQDAESHLLAGYNFSTKNGDAPRAEAARKDLVAMYQALNRPSQVKIYEQKSAR
jgi:serine/threonine-protein kinase